MTNNAEVKEIIHGLQNNVVNGILNGDKLPGVKTEPVEIFVYGAKSSDLDIRVEIRNSDDLELVYACLEVIKRKIELREFRNGHDGNI